jgi:uncharacterized repeat protein (TIGR02543 family)
MYPSAPSPSALTLTFSSPQKYVGFWWSAGSSGNTVRFYDTSNNLLATFTTTTINSILGASAPSPYPGTSTVTALDGSTYKKGYYFGRPAAHASLTPVANTSGNTESHAFLNLYASGSISFGKVEFTGSGFEFDNVAISANPGTPPGSLVFVESVLGKSVNFLPNGGTGSMPAQTEPTNTLTPLTSNTFTRAGYTFNGWHTTSSGSGGTSYTDGANYGFAADITLHAQWTANSLVVTYDSQGGSAIADGATTTGASIAASPGTPTRAGYTFNGWFAASTGGTALTFPYAHGRTANFTIYAQWTVVATTTTPPTTTSTTIVSTTTTTLSPDLSAPKKAVTGKSINIAARGFKAGETVTIRLGNTTQSAVADSSGRISLNIRLNSKSVGRTRVIALGETSGNRAASEISITTASALPATGSDLSERFGTAFVMLVMGGFLISMRRRLSRQG